jgi:hypothetical protein
LILIKGSATGVEMMRLAGETGAVTQAAQSPPPVTHEDVIRLCGEMPDWKVSRILASGATASDLEVAVAWASGEDDVMGEERLPLSGRAAELYEIITADEDLWSDERG